MNRMEKYHADYVSQRKAPPIVAVTGSNESSSALYPRERAGFRSRSPLASAWMATGELSRPVSLYAAISALAAGTGFAGVLCRDLRHSRGDL